MPKFSSIIEWWLWRRPRAKEKVYAQMMGFRDDPYDSSDILQQLRNGKILMRGMRRQALLLWCGGAPGYFPRPPTPPPLFSFLNHTTRIQHTTSMGGPSGRDLNPDDLAVVSEECRSSFHHPTVSP
ncbi:hypothetical protein GEV33_000363 [Tenebrio molitor]|uniref:Uncharacterized protein n=1 Tax=Tenebrio molitor TaxID=7067 RepID=A0A8J6LKJ6_TENMO|nr:hypothetical protein GEV33_000363 [Tenebrio molitor]